MKLCELTIDENGIHFQRTNPNPMNAEQKYTICITLIVAAALTIVFGILFTR